MANHSICLHHNCEQPPIVNVTVVYPPDALKPDGKESKTAYCLDCVGYHVTAMLTTGKALHVAIERIAA